ncbi:hypothetical protein NB311A_11707 [Nitrobacter sp. Nb-311A]|nr:hypothetical protein NB311A_11707 [Nitrobacter sp. Nb-311A]
MANECRLCSCAGKPGCENSFDLQVRRSIRGNGKGNFESGLREIMPAITSSA